MSGENRSRRAVPIGEILDAYLAETEQSSVRPLARVREAWGAIVRDKRIHGTRVAAFQDGRAIIEVKSPPLVAELSQFRRKELLDAVQRFLTTDPKVRELRFRLSAW